MTEKIPSKRGIYLLPSVLTTFGMFAGFYSIISSINGEFTIAAISIMIAMMWDTLDGRVAHIIAIIIEIAAIENSPLIDEIIE